MARIWSCGFELQSVTSGVEWDTTTGLPTISTSTVRSGAASLRCNTSASTAYLQHRWRADATSVFYVRFYLRIASAPAASCVIYSYGDGSAFSSVLRLETNRTLRPYNATTAIGVASAALNLNQWYCVEISYDDASGTNPHTTRLDGVAFNTAVAGANLGGGGVARVGAQTATTADLYLDDIAINDGTGAAQNGFPGPGSITHLLPNGAGDTNGWATVVGGTAGAANNYTRVDETTPNDATDYNATTATGTTLTDFFAMENSATKGIGASDTISLVAVGARVGSSATAAANLALKLKGQAAGTIATGSTVTVNVNGWATHTTAAQKTHSLTAYVNPQTGTAWTPATLDTLQAGYGQATSQSSTRRVTAVWALVEYVPASAASITGTAVAALGGLTGTALSGREVMGTGSASSGLTGTVTGLRRVPGVVSVDLGTFTAAGLGLVQVAGTALVAGALTATASATVVVPGVAPAVLGALTGTAAGGKLVAGAAAANLSGLADATGAVGVTGTVLAALGPVTAVVLGAPLRSGTVVADLGGLTATVAGAHTVLGTSEALLGDTTATATGTPTVTGVSVAALGGVSATVLASVELFGTAAADLGTLHAVVATIPVGVATAVLGGLATTAAGVREVLATTTGDQGGLTATAVGVREAAGVADVALGDLGATATGLASAAQNDLLAALGGLSAAVIGVREGDGTGIATLSAVAVAVGAPIRPGAAEVALTGPVATATGHRTLTAASANADLDGLLAVALGDVLESQAGSASTSFGELVAIARGFQSKPGFASVVIGFTGIAVAFVHPGYPELGAGRPTPIGGAFGGLPGASAYHAGGPTVVSGGSSGAPVAGHPAVIAGGPSAVSAAAAAAAAAASAQQAGGPSVVGGPQVNAPVPV